MMGTLFIAPIIVLFVSMILSFFVRRTGFNVFEFVFTVSVIIHVAFFYLPDWTAVFIPGNDGLTLLAVPFFYGIGPALLFWKNKDLFDRLSVFRLGIVPPFLMFIVLLLDIFLHVHPTSLRFMNLAHPLSALVVLGAPVILLAWLVGIVIYLSRTKAKTSTYVLPGGLLLIWPYYLDLYWQHS